MTLKLRGCPHASIPETGFTTLEKGLCTLRQLYKQIQITQMGLLVTSQIALLGLVAIK